MRKMAVAVAVAAVLLSVLLGPAAWAGPPPGAFPEPPDGFLASSSGEVKGEIRAFCWTESSLTVCGDRFDPIDPPVAVTVELGDPLTLRFDTPRIPDAITVQVRDSPTAFPTGRFDVAPGNPTQFTLDLPPGTYFLDVTARFGPVDSVIYVFEVALVPAAAPDRTCGGKTPTMVGTDGPETITGTAGTDVIDARGGRDTVYGLGGDDVICGGSGSDVLNGGGGDDRLMGLSGSDSIAGGAGNDSVMGGGGDDRMQGNSGDDRVVGGAGNDELAGNGGRDTLDASDSTAYADTLNGGPDPDNCVSDATDTPPALTGSDC